MSRIADVYRKSRSLRPQLDDEAFADLETWIPNELPWELGEPREVATGRLASNPATPVASARRRPLVDARATWHEQLGPVVDRILHAAPQEEHARSLLFLTIDSDPHSQAVSAATADVLAGRTSRAVCIVDANLRSPGLHRSFAPVSTRGLSDLLLEGGDVRLCITKVTNNLWVMPAGSRCADALPCLAERCSAHLTQLLSLFDYVLFDTAAATLSHEAIVLGGCVDGVVLVINATMTRREVARRTAESLQAANATLFGAVLTNRSFPIPEAIYRRL